MPTGTYEPWKAQPAIDFPLSGPPVCVSLGHSNSHPGCMRSVHDEGTGTSFIELRLRGDMCDATNRAEQFYLEPSKQHEGLLHVRCCDNNKYWVAQHHHHDWFVCGAADEPEEDLSNPSCTLFDFVPNEVRQYWKTGIQFRHITIERDGSRSETFGGFASSSLSFFHSQQKKYAMMYIRGTRTYLKLRDGCDDDIYHRNLLDGYNDGYHENVFGVHRLSVQKVLPRYVAFKGDNGKYLALKGQDLQFSSSEITDPAVLHETFTDGYGIVRIRSNSSQRFWRFRTEGREQGFICADSDDAGYSESIVDMRSNFNATFNTYKDVYTLFKVDIKSNSNYIALQSISSSQFLKRFSTYRKTDCLACIANSADESVFQIEEVLRSRDIYDVRYRFGEAKKQSTEVEVANSVVNHANTTSQIQHIQQTIEKTETTEYAWDVSFKVDAGTKVNLKATIPLNIVQLEGSLESHMNFHGEYNFGNKKIQQVKISTVLSCPVPARTKLIGSITGTKVITDIPFSYKQRDVLLSGQVLPVRELHDGIYKAVKVHETNIVTSEEKI